MVRVDCISSPKEREVHLQLMIEGTLVARYLIVFAVFAVFAVNQTVGQPPVQPPSSYYTVVPGDVPIILTAPHGGTLSYPFPPRPCTGSQTCATDTNTRLLTPRASDAFHTLTGKRPYMIVAQGDRAYIDLNRDKTATPNNAYDDPAAEAYYDYYHDTIQGFIDDIKAEYGRGLLLDIHGQSTLPSMNIRGTKNGLTTTELLAEFGSPSLNGVNSIIGSLDQLGYPVDPNVNLPFEDQVENPAFDGGYTVQAYGSNLSTGIDAIQIEFGIDYRSGTVWEQTADDLAIAMNNFYEAYLAQAPGDFDDDGKVDGIDFLAWQRGAGISSGAQPGDGDGNGDGRVDTDDLPVWAINYGNDEGDLSTLTQAIPEPASLALLIIGVVTTASINHRRPQTCGNLVLPILVVVATIVPNATTQADVLTFTDPVAWEAALSTASTLEDFEGASSDVTFGLAYQPTTSPNGDLGLRANANFSTNAYIDVFPYASNGAGINGNVVVNMRFLDQGNSTNSQETVDVFLPVGISAFSFLYNNYDNGGDGTFLSFQGTNGGIVPEFDSSVAGFFGVVDTGEDATISYFSFTGDPATGTGTSAFNSFDDVRYGVATTSSGETVQIPEPHAGLLASALAIVASSSRKRNGLGAQGERRVKRQEG